MRLYALQLQRGSCSSCFFLCVPQNKLVYGLLCIAVARRAAQDVTVRFLISNTVVYLKIEKNQLFLYIPWEKDYVKMLRLVKSPDAVSPLIGMLLILIIVVSALGLVSVMGIPRIDSAKEQAMMENMRSNFLVLQADIHDVVQSPSTGRVTKMRLETGSVTVYAANETVNGTTGYIEFNAKGSVIAYENGAVFAQYPGQDYAEVVGDPLIYVDVGEENITHAYLHVIMINGSKSAAGSGPIDLTLTGRDPKPCLTESQTKMTNFTLTITSKFYRGWHEYFEDLLGASGLNGAAGDYNLSYSPEAETVTVFIDGRDHTSNETDVLLYCVQTEVRVT
jgi:hypothetical protein